MTTDFGWDDYLGPEGRLRASHRELDEERSTPLEPRQLHLRQQLLKPGEIVPLEICIWPTGLIFEAGETLQLEITGKDFVEDRPPKMIIVEDINRGRIRVHTGGEYDSHLLLPACR